VSTGFPTRLREFAMTFEGTREEYPFGPGTAVYKAPNGRMFALVSCHDDGAHVSLKLSPAESEEALTLPFVRPAPYLARNHWVMAIISSESEFDITCAWIHRSHELVTANKRRARR
jgi:predicted DNA-binding protein (MmcQ/YjbR family)